MFYSIKLCLFFLFACLQSLCFNVGLSELPCHAMPRRIHIWILSIHQHRLDSFCLVRSTFCFCFHRFNAISWHFCFLLLLSPISIRYHLEIDRVKWIQWVEYMRFIYNDHEFVMSYDIQINNWREGNMWVIKKGRRPNRRNFMKI